MLKKPSQIIADKFPFSPTKGQKHLFSLFDKFLNNKQEERYALMLKGYAGTGKTSIVSALVKALPAFDFKYLLMAPTGRAAKVMASYAERNAFTVHKIIYQRAADPISGKYQFRRRRNYAKNTLFIVDEASMLADDPSYGRNGLLSDLIDFVFEHKSNKLMLVGDAAQLPPVGQAFSNGLNEAYLASGFGLTLLQTELTEVTRQGKESGILYNATKLRQHIVQKDLAVKFETKNFSDIYRMSGQRLEDGLRYAYDKFGKENTVVICRSNRQAIDYNRYVRNQIFFYENELEVGDYLMIVRNNYFFLDEDTPAGFLANGDFIEIIKIINLEDMHGFRFATLELQLLDYPDQPPFEAKVLLDTLHSPTTSLPEEAYDRLFESVFADYQDAETRAEQQEAIRNDLYLNALQVKYAYALTCHKAQGGQWDAVFVDQGYMKDDMLNQEYLRWLYTAVTRSKEELFLMNFDHRFF